MLSLLRRLLRRRSGKTHIRVPSVEGQLRWPHDVGELSNEDIDRMGDE